ALAVPVVADRVAVALVAAGRVVADRVAVALVAAGPVVADRVAVALVLAVRAVAAPAADWIAQTLFEEGPRSGQGRAAAPPRVWRSQLWRQLSEEQQAD